MPTAKHRVSLNLAADEYAELAALAQQNRLSMAWLAREALITFLAQHRENALASPCPIGASRGESVAMEPPRPLRRRNSRNNRA